MISLLSWTRQVERCLQYNRKKHYSENIGLVIVESAGNDFLTGFRHKSHTQIVLTVLLNGNLRESTCFSQVLLLHLWTENQKIWRPCECYLCKETSWRQCQLKKKSEALQYATPIFHIIKTQVFCNLYAGIRTNVSLRWVMKLIHVSPK